jgi:diguanylate cyclase (GGDEF)-like protein
MAKETQPVRLEHSHQLFREITTIISASDQLSPVLDAISVLVRAFFEPLSFTVTLAKGVVPDIHDSTASDPAPTTGRVKGSEAAVEPDSPVDAPPPAPVSEACFQQNESSSDGSNEVILAVPIAGRDHMLGTLSLDGRGTALIPGESDLDILKVLAGLCSIAIENSREIERIHGLTITDDATGLFNSRYLKFLLEAEIYRSGRFGYEFSLAFMDLDYFKRVNDAHGHLIGSRLLGLVGDLIKGQLRLIDSAFRYGGDEFVLLLPQTSKQNAMIVVRRLREALNSHVFFAGEGKSISVKASFGVAAFPVDGRSPQELLSSADEAMYRVKSTTRDDVAAAGDLRTP